MAELFHVARGIKLTAIDLALDVPRRQPRGFISHAHADHMGRHELAFCTPPTAALYRHRLGNRPVVEMPFFRPLEWNDLELTTLPAGHVWGAAMLLVSDGDSRLLYTGDLRMRASRTAAAAEPREADVLIIESTFGSPQFRFPPREETIEQLLAWIGETLAGDVTPVIYAYTLGKSQEVTRILSDHGFRVMQHPATFAVSQQYEASGCRLGDFRLFDKDRCQGHVILAAPPGSPGGYLELPARKRTAMLTGWALRRGERHRRQVDRIFPFSDHADYDELLECVERVGPRRVYCTHGPEGFAERLRGQGWDARELASE